ncbi:MAG: AmmeMemoRadiSam system radical SAM enzyme [Acidobacteria bacterium]|jgi:pyruvate formate lyase activating enzyme|nr:AmmeMemoRadiSam system radical SAM enzyme [Acidobacteriota bacterium]
MSISRRRFVKALAGSGVALAVPLLLPAAAATATPGRPRARGASHYVKLGGGTIECRLCPHRCRVAAGERGHCGVRENRGGAYQTLVYGQPSAVHVDPIEKKPLFHYFPGSRAFSLATVGCNFSCRFCQNWEISQRRPEEVETIDMLPDAVMRLAKRNHCRVVAHTYNEPVISFEYVRDCAALGRERGVPNVMISNGFIEKAPLRELCRFLGAVKIDLKAFSKAFYLEQCGGLLQPVLNTLLTLRAEKTWFEVVVLLIPGLNDSRAEIGAMCRWLARELGPDVPLHFSRFAPTYLLKNVPPTPPATLHLARRIALDAGIRFCYVGNLLSDAEHTYCPSCGKVLLRRLMFSVDNEGLRDGRCGFCQTVIPGVFA